LTRRPARGFCLYDSGPENCFTAAISLAMIDAEIGGVHAGLNFGQNFWPFCFVALLFVLNASGPFVKICPELFS